MRARSRPANQAWRRGFPRRVASRTSQPANQTTSWARMSAPTRNPRAAKARNRTARDSLSRIRRLRGASSRLRRMSAKTSPSPVAAPASEHRSAVDIFNARAVASAGRIALRHKEGDEWKATTWSQWASAAREIAGGLIELGVAPGDRVAILAATRREWVMCDVGVLTAGAVVVPIYASNLPDQCEYILQDAGCV